MGRHVIERIMVNTVLLSYAEMAAIENPQPWVKIYAEEPIEPLDLASLFMAEPVIENHTNCGVQKLPKDRVPS